jgi:hypothetical protein
VTLDTGAFALPDPRPMPSPAAMPEAPERKRPAGHPLDPPASLVSAWADPLSPDSPELAFRIAAPAVTTPEVGAGLTKEQILRGIQAESLQKRAEQKNLEREVGLAKARELAAMADRAQSERVAFHDELRRLLKEMGDEAGPEIKALCDRYGRSMHPEAEKLMNSALNRAATRAKREFKFALMRYFGAPEAMLLDDLAADIDQTRGTRGGPRDRNAVRVIAGRLLLRYPPPTPPGPGSAPPAAAAPTSTPAPTKATVARTPAVPAARPARPSQ